jgi:hypothetical protein
MFAFFLCRDAVRDVFAKCVGAKSLQYRSDPFGKKGFGKM